MEHELVSIGIPTYNRPEGLRKTLESIIKQTYQNLEIIVSDNCSPDPEVRKVIDELTEKDSRIKYFRQGKNQGAPFNFKFVYEKASANYFMWAADDDYFISENLVEELIKYAADNVLCFSDFVRSNDANSDFFANSYAQCQSKIDYIYAWLQNGSGQPTYGMYNLNLMVENELKFVYDDDLVYYTEGTMLHKLFLTGKVKFVPNVYIFSDQNSSKPKTAELCDSFLKYSERTVEIFKNSDLHDVEKQQALNILKQHQSGYLFVLFSSPTIEEKQAMFFKLLEHRFLLN